MCGGVCHAGVHACSFLMNVCTVDDVVLVSVEAPKDPQDKMEPVYTPSPLQSASSSRIPFLSPFVSLFVLCSSVPLFYFFFELGPRVRVFPHANAKSMELLEIIATVDTGVSKASSRGKFTSTALLSRKR